MFETQFTLWLQSFSSLVLDNFFLALTWLGYEQFLQAFLVFIVFGINVRYGFMLSQAIIWTGAITEGLKHAFQYPRPFMVDNSVVLIGQPSVPASPLNNQGADGFWSLLASKTVADLRTLYSGFSGSWGIPSGHAAGSIVIWGSLMHWFHNRTIWIICLLLILLIPLSRLYLGMHFIADLIAGYLLGCLCFFVIIRTFFNLPKINHWLFSGQSHAILSFNSLSFLLIFILPGCAALFIESVNSEDVTLILGCNLGFYGVWLNGLPTIRKSIKEASLRLAIAFPMLGFVIMVDHLSDRWLAQHFGPIGSGTQSVILNGSLIYLGIELLIKMNFMSRLTDQKTDQYTQSYVPIQD